MNKKKFCKIFFPILGAAVLITGIYWTVIEFVLKDYKNLSYITFQYVQASNSDEEEGAIITRVEEKSKFPATFDVPSQILGHPVVGIGDNAFAGLNNLKSVILPKSVTSIGNNAFQNCPNLKKVVVKGNLTSVGNDIFLESNNWEGFKTDDEFIMFESFLYKYNGQMKENSVLKGAENRGVNESNDYNYVYISEDVKALCSGAFADQNSIIRVEIPERFTKIEHSMFQNCNNLKEVELNNVTSISSDTFRNCLNLENIDISNLAEIGSNAFNNTSISNINLSNDLAYLNEGVFANCNNIVSVEIPDSVERIGNNAFKNDTKLSSISMSDNVSLIGVGAFAGTSLETFTFPKNIKSIQSELFLNVSTLREVVLPDVVEEVVTNEGSTTTNYSGIVLIGSSAFKGTTSLKSISIPSLIKDGTVINTLTQIDSEAFESSGIESITIPNTVRLLEKGVFKNCANLEEVVFEDNSTLNKIGSECFNGTTSLEAIDFPDSVTQMQDAILANSGVRHVKISKNRDFNTINDKFFENCKNLTEIEIPANVNTLKAGVFSGCSNLRNITFEDNNILKSIGKEIFAKCSSLESITISNSLTSISNNMFEGCTNLGEVIINENSKLTSIGEYAFKNCTSLTTIVVPKKVTSIGKNAFENCDSLVIYFECEEENTRWNDNWNVSNCEYHFYSEVEQDGYWHYDSQGKVTLW